MFQNLKPQIADLDPLARALKVSKESIEIRALELKWYTRQAEKQRDSICKFLRLGLTGLRLARNEGMDPYSTHETMLGPGFFC